MEKQIHLDTEGQELQQAEVNAVGNSAGLADDRVFCELIRMSRQGTSAKAVMPWGKKNWNPRGSLTSTATVQGNTADGKVRVMPIRAFVSPAADPLADTSGATQEIQLENERGIRSGYLIAAETGYTELSIAANAGGNPRWTLVYLKIQPDLATDPVTRYIKDPDTDVVGPTPVSTIKTTVVSLLQVDGSVASTPTRPALPADVPASGIYYIKLAYIWVPNGFTSGSTVARGQIQEVMPVAQLHTTIGPLLPANQSYEVGGTVYTRQSSIVGVLQPGAYLPSSMRGCEELIVGLQLVSTPPSHTDGDVIDDSRDWRFRYFKTDWGIGINDGDGSGGSHVPAATDLLLASDRRTAPALVTAMLPTPSAVLAGLDPVVTGSGVLGQSFQDDTATGGVPAIADCAGVLLYLNPSNSHLTGGARIYIYVRASDGAIVLHTVSLGIVGELFLWIHATGPYSNFGTV